MARQLNKICLINPKRAVWGTTEKIKQALLECHKHLKAFHSPPLSLLTIAALTPPEIEIELVQEDFDPIDFDRKYDLVGITAMTHTADRAYWIADQFKSKGVYVVIGGIHATVMPEEASLHADSVVVGEAEELWPALLQDFIEGQPRRIYRNPPGHRPDLKRSPIPRYDLLRSEKSARDPGYYYNLAPLQLTRGCPRGCEFCLVSDINGRKPRRKTLDQVRTEIMAIKRILPSHMVAFVDDNLFIDRKFSWKLLEELERLRVRWVAQSDIGIGSDDTFLEQMHRSGCVFLIIGFESLDEQNLAALNPNKWKFRQLEYYEKNVRNIQEHGIVVIGSFIAGLDNDDPGVFARVVDFLNRNRVTGQMSLATPLPGSRMFERLKHEGRFLYPEPFWERCTFYDVLFKMKKMTKEEAEEGIVWAYRQFMSEQAMKNRTEYFKEVFKKLA